MKLCFPNFGCLGLALETLCQQEGLDYIAPSDNLEEAMMIGSRLSPEGVCLPMKRMAGEFVQAAHKGADTALFLGGNGPCRFGYFAPMFQTILNQNHISMRVLALEAPASDRTRFLRELSHIIGRSESYTVRLLLQGWNAIRWLDRWEEARLASLALTGKKGPKAQSAESFRLLSSRLKDWCRQFAVTIPQGAVRIGIVGDIYTTVDPAINHGLQERLAEMGIFTRRSIQLSQHLLHMMTGNRLQNRAAAPYLDRGIGGFAQETIGASQQMLKAGFDGLIQVYPLSCMPEIVADGILAGIQQDSGIPILRLILDEQSGEAGIQTRLEAFADMLKRRKQTKDGEGL